MRIAVTGVSGFLGSEFVRRWLLDEGLAAEIERVYVLLRPQGPESAETRFEKIVEHWRMFFEIESNKLSKIQVVPCDLHKDACLPENFFEKERIDYIVHCAADTEFSVSLAKARETNCAGTRRLLNVAKHGNVKCFVHFSTAFACGTATGTIAPGQPTEKFNNFYEQSKYEAEVLVRNSGIPFMILRPSIVVGDSRHGYVRRMRVIYSAVRAWMTGHLPRVPVDARARVDMIPIDYIVNATWWLMQLPDAAGKTLHLCAGEHFVSPVDIMQVSARELNIAPRKLISPYWVAFFLSGPFKFLFPYGVRQIWETMRWHVPYLGTRRRSFDMTATVALVPQLPIPKFADFGAVIFRFCAESRWGKRGLKEKLHGI